MKDNQHPFAQIQRTLINDNSVSSDLRFFIIYCISKPDSWTYVASNIAKDLKISTRTLYRILKEGVDAGYILRHQGHDGRKWLPISYRIFEVKDASRNNDQIANTSNAGSCNAGFGALSNTESSSKISKKKEREKPPTDFIPHGTKVRFKPGEYEALVAEHTKPVVDEVIVSMNLYLDSHGKPAYKDCASAVKNWIHKDKAKVTKPLPSKYPPKKEDWLKINQSCAKAWCVDKPWLRVDNYYVNNTRLPFSQRQTSELDMRILEPESFAQLLERLNLRGT